MLFTSKFTSRMWDTWLYHHAGVFYLYYLITEEGPGAGFGVATSTDGVHWEDHGWGLRASEQVQRYLGTGSVWKDPNFDRTGRFLCNYSEWRLEGKHFVQYIYFAWSDDLLHWRKLEELPPFGPDDLFYKRTEEDARWDCIWTVERLEGGYYGYWTATPRACPGFGYGHSLDGVRWKALEPPRIEWGDVEPFRSIEVGAVRQFEGRYYAMLGDYTPNHCGMYTFLSDTPAGPFRPSPRNFALLRGQARMHAYFTRFCELPGEVLVNHHATSYGETPGSPSTTYFAPLKKAALVDGALYLQWWPGNERLKEGVVELLQPEDNVIHFDPAKGFLLEGVLRLPGRLRIATGAATGEKTGVEIRVGEKGVTEIGPAEGEIFVPEERSDREVRFANPAGFRLLLREKMVELYLDDYHIQSYSMVKPSDGRIETDVQEVRVWE